MKYAVICLAQTWPGSREDFQVFPIACIALDDAVLEGYDKIPPEKHEEAFEYQFFKGNGERTFTDVFGDGWKDQEFPSDKDDEAADAVTGDVVLLKDIAPGGKHRREDGNDPDVYLEFHFVKGFGSKKA